MGELIAKNAAKRLYDLGYLFYFHLVDLNSLWEFFPHEKFPIAFFEKGGNLNVVEWGSLVDQPIYKLSPVRSFQYRDGDIIDGFATLLDMARENSLSQHYDGILQKWIGDATTCPVISTGRADKEPVLGSAQKIWDYAIGKSHALESIRFLRPCEKESHPLIQELHVPVTYPEKLPDIEVVLQKAASNPDDLDLIEWSVLRKDYSVRYKGFYRFSSPFQNHFSFGTLAVNINHPLGKSLFQLECLVNLKDTGESFSPAVRGLIRDAVRKLSFGSVGGEIIINKNSYKTICNQLEKLYQLIENNRALAEIAHNIKNSIPKVGEFIPGTYATKRISVQNFSMSKHRVDLDEIQEFGDVLQ